MKRNIVLCILFLLIIALISLGENYYYKKVYQDNNSLEESIECNCEEIVIPSNGIPSNSLLENVSGIFYAVDDLNDNIEYIKYIKLNLDGTYEVGHFNSVTKTYHLLTSNTFKVNKDGWLKFNELPISQNGKEFSDYFVYSDNTLILRNGLINEKENCSLTYIKLPDSFFEIDVSAN